MHLLGRTPQGYDNTWFKVLVLKPRQKRRAETVVFFGAGVIAPQPNRFEPGKVMAIIDFVINSGRTVIVLEAYES